LGLQFYQALKLIGHPNELSCKRPCISHFGSHDG
jgi:hypothetical protein